MNMNRYFLAALMLAAVSGAGAADYLTTSEERPIIIINDSRGGRDDYYGRRYDRYPPPPPPRRYFRYDNGGMAGSVESGRNSIRFNSGGITFIDNGTYDSRGFRVDPPPRGYDNGYYGGHYRR